VHERIEFMSGRADKCILMHPANSRAFPRAFCWTRFGPEAGEPFEQILDRKNAEREACGGVFYWGIGSAVGAALAALTAEIEQPEVLFSPIKGTPRRVDVAPAHVVKWSAGTGLSGDTVGMPDAACVTSRWDPARPDAARYALVCASDEPLRLRDRGELEFTKLTNLCSGSPIGPSQVTAVVCQDVDRQSNRAPRTYPVVIRASLVWPYFLRLSEPTFLEVRRRQAAFEPDVRRLAV